MADGMSSVNMNGGRMRMFGLASGLDIDSMVQKLMKAESAPLEKMKQDKQVMEWQRDDYREMNKLLTDLKSLSFDMSLQSAFLLKSSTSSNSSFVTATASGNTSAGSFLINKVTQLASAAFNSSSVGITKDTTTKIDVNQPLYLQKDKFDDSSFFKIKAESETQTVDVATDAIQLKHGSVVVDGTHPINVKVDGTNYTVYTEPADYAAAVDADPDAQVALFHENTGALSFNKEIAAGSTITADYSYNGFDFDLTTYDENGQAIDLPAFEFDGNQSLSQIMTKVNESGYGVQMFFDESTQQISISRTMTGDFIQGTDGSGNKLHEITFTGAFLTNGLKLDELNETDGADAIFTINGLDTNRHSNEFNIDGMDFVLHQTFDSTQSVSISISDNVDEIADKVKAWVDKYNEVIGKINDKLDEKRYRDYKPLTDAQQKDMGDKEIELWTEKAKSGLLSNDTILSSGLSQLRMALYTPVSSVSNSDYNQLTEIGIKAVADYKEHGKLEIDMDDLKAAISSDPKSVMEMFTSNSTDFDNQGLMERVSDTIDSMTHNIENKAGNTDWTYTQFSMGRNMHELDDRIDSFQDHLSQVEDRYYRQFTAMEQAIQRSNQQSGFIMSNFS